MELIKELKKEHAVLSKKIQALREMFGFSLDRERIKLSLGDFEKFWNSHEEKEENFFNERKDLDFAKMIIEEHLDLRGHWEVIQKYLDKRDVALKVALETDGKMILDKFEKHIKKEEEYFNSLSHSQ